ncbi:MAG: 3-hydroxybutyryl-CoA dehydrogenase, partial [Sphingomonas sp.]
MPRSSAARSVSTSVTGTLEIADVGSCDLVIEAAYESMAVKQAIFTRL